MPRQHAGRSQCILACVHVGVLSATYAAGGSSLLSFPRCWCRHAMLEDVADVRTLLYTCDDTVFRRPPGTKFTYDSDTFIAYLSYLLDQVAGAAHNSSARQFADEFFARPLGLPDLYAFQNGDPENIGDKPYEKVPVLRRVHAGPPFRTPSRSLHCFAVGHESTIPLTQRQRMPATKVVDTTHFVWHRSFSDFCVVLFLT